MSQGGCRAPANTSARANEQQSGTWSLIRSMPATFRRDRAVIELRFSSEQGCCPCSLPQLREIGHQALNELGICCRTCLVASFSRLIRSALKRNVSLPPCLRCIVKTPGSSICSARARRDFSRPQQQQHKQHAALRSGAEPLPQDRRHRRVISCRTLTNAAPGVLPLPGQTPRSAPANPRSAAAPWRGAGPGYRRAPDS